MVAPQDDGADCSNGDDSNCDDALGGGVVVVDGDGGDCYGTNSNRDRREHLSLPIIEWKTITTLAKTRLQHKFNSQRMVAIKCQHQERL